MEAVLSKKEESGMEARKNIESSRMEAAEIYVGSEGGLVARRI
jgi:hypothetical protein